MGEFADVVRNRRMTRSFSTAPVDPLLLDSLVDLATRSPSAGKTQGWHIVVLEGVETARYWDITLPAQRRASFRWTRLLDAPLLMLVLADPDAYVERYGEPDKATTGLGASVDAWPTPYWTIDASMAVMTLLHAAEDVGLGALFFGVFQREADVRAALGIPDRLQLIGAVALGHPHVDEWNGDPRGRSDSTGRSAARRRRPPGEVLHRSGW